MAAAELSDRLQAVLGAAYRIEKELGGGGMSRVFVAEETRLARRVVVKVLPPDLALEIRVDRFNREIQLSASLQHPHIVPLLAAGGVEDLLYYTMPFLAARGRLADAAARLERPLGGFSPGLLPVEVLRPGARPGQRAAWQSRAGARGLQSRRGCVAERRSGAQAVRGRGAGGLGPPWRRAAENRGVKPAR